MKLPNYFTLGLPLDKPRPRVIGEQYYASWADAERGKLTTYTGKPVVKRKRRKS